MLLLREVELYRNYIFGLKFLILFLDSANHVVGSAKYVNTTLDSSFHKECSNNEKYFNGYCYEVVTSGRNFQDASSYCKKEDGRHLVSIHNREEKQFVLDITNTDIKIFWIGLHLICLNKTQHWSDGTLYQFSIFYYNIWDNFDSICTILPHKEFCGVKFYRTWEFFSCDNLLHFVCKRSISSAAENNSQVMISHPSYCKAEWHTFRDNCYLPVEQNWVNFTDANDACILQNATLVSIKDAEEQKFLSYLMQSLKHDAWIGFHYTAESREYTWLDNSHVSYMNWTGHHNFSNTKDFCVFMSYSGQWKNSACDKTLPFICKTAKDSVSPLSDGVLAGILISVIILALALFGTYFYFKSYVRRCIRLGFSKETSTENVSCGVNTSL